jgi:hypothetical protein
VCGRATGRARIIDLTSENLVSFFRLQGAAQAGDVITGYLETKPGVALLGREHVVSVICVACFD